MKLADRLLTIVVTATLTSAAWIILSPSVLQDGIGGLRAAPLPTPSATPEAAPGPRDAAVGGLAIPVLNVPRSQLADTFTDERGEGERMHEALDIMAPRGTPVVAAAPGTIERLFVSEEGGNTIYVRSDDRETLYYYAHLDAYAPELREGQKVSRGQRLGTVGSTGNATQEAPHLHFAVMRTTPGAQWWEPAAALNPFPLLGG
jgi:murein DD-endopeptidase MepM/ murein hydrolase activator NlpD